MELDLRSTYLEDGQGPPPSERDVLLQKILHKQTDTHITLSSQFEQHRDFSLGGELTSLPLSSAGLKSAGELLMLEEETQSVAQLIRAGMSTQDISLYLQAKERPNKPLTVSSSNYSCEPSALEQRLSELKGQVDRCARSLQEEAPPTSSVPLEDPFTYITRFAQKLEARRKRKRPKKAPIVNEEESEDAAPVTVDPSQWHAVVPLQEEDILANRMTNEEIRNLPKFSSYTRGEPHSVLFLKNLHPKATLQELIAVFGRYDTPEEPVKYRTMTGKLRRQAFVSFQDVETATKALTLANGYRLRGQPMIITFAQQRRGKLDHRF